jgi:LuxR family transcriptional regulator, maltose regulon positive regulatory protein
VDGPNSYYAQGLHFGLSRVFLAWNCLDEAGESLERCHRLSQQAGNLNLQTACLALTARLEGARGNLEKAQAALITAEQLMHDHPLSPHRSMWVESALARLWLEQGKMEQALLLLHRTGICPNALSPGSLALEDINLEDPAPYRLEPGTLVLLRLFLALGNPEAALALVGRLLPGAQAGQRMQTVIELTVLQALAFQAKKDLPCALAALEQAIALARPDQSRRFFLEEGERMGKLLYHAQAQGPGGEFVAELLSMMNLPAADEKSGAASVQTLLVEPLSGRELEILKCLAEGRSNQEIAARFVLSPKTVKRHLSNIYAKLEAKNRTQAVSLARSLKLLD